MKSINKRKLSLVVISLLMSMNSAVNAYELESLGDIAGGNVNNNVTGISADGTVVVGYGTDAAGMQAFRWTSAGGKVILGNLGTNTTYGNGISDNGSVIVGQGNDGANYSAFIWTAGEGMVSLGDLVGGNTYSSATAVSGDGLTVVGQGSTANSGPYAEAMRWTSSGGMVALGILAGGRYNSSATGVNSDGSVIVGTAKNASNSSEAFHWTSGTGTVGMGFLTSGTWSEAKAVNGDGSVIVGASQNSDGYGEAFRWENNVMTGLGILSGYDGSSADGVSNDGRVVVGHNENNDLETSEAFRWTSATGMLTIKQWLGLSGYTLTGWTDMTANDVSDDGSVIVGQGTTATGIEAFIARGQSGLISIKTFSTSLESVNSVSAQGSATASIILHGAHGHPGATRALDEKYTMWVAGDLGYDDRHDSTDDSKVGEIGIGYHYNKNLSFSVALGKISSSSDLLYAGTSDSSGEYIAIDTDIQLPTSLPLFLTLTYLHGKSDVNIKRGYENAGSLDSSTGNTEQSFSALRSRLQWQSAKSIKSTVLHPYIEYNVIKVTTNGYTETGGGFPAVFNESTETVHDFRVGADIDYMINDNNRIISTLEGIHRTDKRGNGVSGQVIGLFAFDINGREYNQNWMRGTLGFEHTFTDKGRITLTLNTSTQGEDPQYWGGFNYSIGF